MPVSEAVRARGETIAAFATAGLHFVFYDVLSMRGAFIALAVGGWLGYVAWRIRREPRCAAEYGLSRAGLAPTARAAGVVLVLGVLACLGVGLRARRAARHPQHGRRRGALPDLGARPAADRPGDGRAEPRAGTAPRGGRRVRGTSVRRRARSPSAARRRDGRARRGLRALLPAVGEPVAA